MGPELRDRTAQGGEQAGPGAAQAVEARGLPGAETPGPRQRRDERLAAWAAFLRAHAAVKAKLERELLTERDLPLTWYEVLLHLDGHGGEMRMQELARSVLLSKSGLTRLVDRMEGAGLVVRRTCESDRRGAFVGLTPAGEAALRGAAPTHLRGISEHFSSHLTTDELRVLRRIMERLADAAEEGGAAAAIPCAGDHAGDAG